MTRFQRWAVATTVVTYLLIAVGGLVRASGSGLGCPDWPKCFDRWVPPTDVSEVPSHIDPALFNVTKAWTEYLNRGLGVIVGLLIFVTLVFAIRHHRKDPRVLWPTVAAFVLVGIQGLLGARVVSSQLKPLILSAHLALALVIGGLLIYATVCAFFDGGRPLPDLPPWRQKLGRLVNGVSALALVQVAIGAIVRGRISLLANAAAPPPRDTWLGQVGSIYAAHTTFAVVVLAAIGFVVWRVLDAARGDPRLRGAAWAVLATAVAQPLTGLVLSRFDVPPTFQVLHLWLGSLLVAALMILAIVCYRAPVRRDGEGALIASAAPAAAPRS